MPKRGRPSKFSKALTDEIVERLSSGEPLAAICRDEHMPCVQTVYDWMEAHQGFSGRFALARANGHDAIAARTRMTARGKTEDDGGDSSGDVKRDRLIVETDLKLLAKWDPKRYGDRLGVELTTDEDTATLLAKARERAGKGDQ